MNKKYFKIVLFLAVVGWLFLTTAFAIDYPKYDKRLGKHYLGKELHKDATIKHDPNSARMLGSIYLNKIKDRNLALKWFKIAHEAGIDSSGLYLIASNYYDIHDFENAIKWTELAYQNENENAVYFIAYIYYTEYMDYNNAENGILSEPNKAIMIV